MQCGPSSDPAPICTSSVAAIEHPTLMNTRSPISSRPPGLATNSTRASTESTRTRSPTTITPRFRIFGRPARRTRFPSLSAVRKYQRAVDQQRTSPQTEYRSFMVEASPGDERLCSCLAEAVCGPTSHNKRCTSGIHNRRVSPRGRRTHAGVGLILAARCDIQGGSPPTALATRCAGTADLEGSFQAGGAQRTRFHPVLIIAGDFTRRQLRAPLVEVALGSSGFNLGLLDRIRNS